MLRSRSDCAAARAACSALSGDELALLIATLDAALEQRHQGLDHALRRFLPWPLRAAISLAAPMSRLAARAEVHKLSRTLGAADGRLAIS